MVRNTIQFQKGLSLPAFHRQNGQEHPCWRMMFQLRYPCGFNVYRVEVIDNISFKARRTCTVRIVQ